MSALDPNTAPPARHPFVEAWRHFRANRAALVALTVLGLIVFGAIFGPWIYPTDPFDMVWAPFSPPGEQGFMLGTDYLGRDLLAMIINGARVSLLVGLSAALVSIFIGVTVGAVAGFYRGIIEEILMRITEFFQVLPTLLFSMVIVALFGASLPMITLAIGIVSWTAVARITRAEFLRLVHRSANGPGVYAAHGARPVRDAWRSDPGRGGVAFENRWH